MVKKGTVWEIDHDIETDIYTVRIKTQNGTNDVTPPIVVPQRIAENLTTGVEVAYIIFDDFTGIVVDRLDGRNGEVE